MLQEMGSKENKAIQVCTSLFMYFQKHSQDCNQKKYEKSINDNINQRWTEQEHNKK